jgi:hypothetical protein
MVRVLDNSFTKRDESSRFASRNTPEQTIIAVAQTAIDTYNAFRQQFINFYNAGARVH